MIKVTVQYNDHSIDIHFPCSETTLYSALTEIHAADDTPPELFIRDVVFPEELDHLKDRFVNLDELNYLAKRMESFFGTEEEQFYEAMKQEGFTELKDLINLTFNLNKYCLIQNIGNMGKVGREYVLNRDGCIPAYDDANPKYAEIGRRLMQSGTGIVTEHGILFVDEDIPFEEPYDGQVFPPYVYDADVFCIAKAEYNDKAEYLYLPCEKSAIDKAIGRLGAPDPDSVNITLDGFTADNPEWMRRLREITANESIYDVNELVKAISNADMQLDKLTAVAEYAENNEDVGRRFVEYKSDYAVPATVVNFINYNNYLKRRENSMSIYDDWNRMTKVNRANYPPGTRILLLGMEDPYHPVPPGTRGTVDHVDDAGTIHMKWDNGSSLGLCTEVDVFRTLTAAELAAEQNQRQNADTQNVLHFGDDSLIAVPNEPIDCSTLGYFDELECDCWELVKKYCDKLGIQVLPNVDGEQTISFDIAKGIQDHILSAFEDAGVSFQFAVADEDEAPTMSM